jgi:hypothetical protein
MTPRPEPKDHTSAEHTQWATTANRETRAAHLRYYWGHRGKGEPQPHLYWSEIEVSEEEFRAGVTREDLKILGMA